MNATQEIHVLRSFVRGEVQWQALRTLRARLNFDHDGLHLEEPAGAPVYEPSVAEVATGLLAQWTVGTTLQDWARVLLATGMIDLGCLEDHPDGETLLETVWDAAEGSHIDECRLVAARRLATLG